MTGPAHTDLLRLTLTPGLGPVLIARCLEAFGSPAATLGASAADLRRIKGIGEAKADTIRRGMDASDALAREELDLAHRLGVSLIAITDHDYPPLLRQIADAPPLLYVRGRLDAAQDRHCVAIVGSRACTHYGVDQTERFAALLAEAGLTIVSGGARGIDTAAHRAALRVSGRTVVVMGCGLTHAYPPENCDLFDKIAPPTARARAERVGALAAASAQGFASGGALGGSGSPTSDASEPLGAVISELPLRTSPAPDNFPARNRIISGMALGVLVIEAAKGSGALITAKAAAEDQGREVMAVPGRLDSPASEGCNELIKRGGATLVTSPGDVIELLEQPARYLHAGVHDTRYADPGQAHGSAPARLFDSLAPGKPAAPGASGAGASSARPIADAGLTPTQRALVDALVEPKSIDELTRETGLPPGNLLAAATVLEVRRLVSRMGNRLARR